MITIRFITSHRVGWDGINAVQMAPGDVRENVDPDLARRLISMGVAVAVVDHVQPDQAAKRPVGRPKKHGAL